MISVSECSGMVGSQVWHLTCAADGDKIECGVVKSAIAVFNDRTDRIRLRLFVDIKGGDYNVEWNGFECFSSVHEMTLGFRRRLDHLIGLCSEAAARELPVQP